MTRTPHFFGLSCVILHDEDANTDRLMRQLHLLGIRASRQWTPLDAACLPDLILIDADQGWDELLPFQGQCPPRPVIALIGTEAPGRISWALRQGTTAFIPKPVTAAAIYPALVLGVSLHQAQSEQADRLAHLEERLKWRPVVYAAIGKLQQARQVTADQAYGLLREAAMRRRMTVEEVAASVAGGTDTLKEVG